MRDPLSVIISKLCPYSENLDFLPTTVYLMMSIMHTFQIDGLSLFACIVSFTYLFEWNTKQVKVYT